MDDKPKLLRVMAEAPVYGVLGHTPILQGAAKEIENSRELLFRSYLALRVLRTMCEKNGLTIGAHTAEDLIKDIVKTYPKFDIKVKDDG